MFEKLQWSDTSIGTPAHCINMHASDSPGLFKSTSLLSSASPPTPPVPHAQSLVAPSCAPEECSVGEVCLSGATWVKGQLNIYGLWTRLIPRLAWE